MNLCGLVLHTGTIVLLLIPKEITGSSSTILQYSMNLRKGPKDPYLHSLMFILDFCFPD